MAKGEARAEDQAALEARRRVEQQREREKRARGGGGLIDSPDADRLYRSRMHERSLSWQRAMLVVARDALPALVETDDQANIDQSQQDRQRPIHQCAIDQEINVIEPIAQNGKA